MTDIVLDTEQITINVVAATDIDIINVTAPPYLMVGSTGTVEFDIVNNGDVVDCFAKVTHDGNEIHRWDGTIVNGGTQHISCNVTATNDNPIVLDIEAGYTYA